MPSPQEKLKNLRILVTRPYPQGLVLCKEIEAQGGKAIHFPVIEIQPVSTLEDSLKTMGTQDWLIFISPQAVSQSAEFIKTSWPNGLSTTRFAAIGAGTGLAMQAAGLPTPIYPDEWSSEGLLKLPQFQNIAGQHIAILCGKGGRELLEQELSARGATVDKIIAYQRQLPTVDVSQYLDLLQRHKIDIIICTSQEGLQNLKILLKPAWAILRTMPVLVVSDRLIECAKNLEFQTIFSAKNASFDAILEAITKRNL